MESFEAVYEELFPQVYRYLLVLCGDRDLAEELTQETFFQAIQHIDSFRGDCKLYVWLCQIGKRKYLAGLRRQKRSGEMPNLERPPSPDQLEERLLDRESAMELHRRLHALPEPYREVFSLRVFGELSFGEIAQLFSRTESWARVTYHRARSKLKEEDQ